VGSIPVVAVGSSAKRHHFLPETYLQPWVDGNGQVAVRRRGTSSTFLTSTRNVGVEAGLYGRGADAVWREKNFGLLEDKWPHLRQELIAHGHLFGVERDSACLFLAVQVARTREHIAQATFASELAEFTDERPPGRDTVRRFIRQRHGHDPDAAEVEGAWNLAAFQIMSQSPPSFDEAFSIGLDVAATKLAPLFSQLHWRVELGDQPVLWTGDRAVMPWRPPSPRDRFEGVGYAESDEIRVPLSPVAVLIMSRTPRTSPVHVSARRLQAYNSDIAAQCFEFVVASPGRRARLERVWLAPTRAAVRFNMAPGTRVEPDGSRVPMGDVIHMWIPLRAVAEEA
jgi:hypothetical protein